MIQLLAEHQEVQEVLRRELLDATTHAGRTLFDFDYEGFAKLPYLEAVVRETIRMFVSSNTVTPETLANPARRYPVFYMSNRVYAPSTTLSLTAY